MKQRILLLSNIIIPTAIFYGVYSFFGLIPAIALSMLFSIVNIAIGYRKKKRVSNTQIFGLVGLALSLIGVLFTDNEKLYYIPALVSNFAFLLFALILAVRKRSVFHYFIRDFDFKISNEISEKLLLKVNIIWIVFFSIKILSKILGIAFLDFKTLYWLVFVLGDPLTIIAVILTIYFIRIEAVKSNATVEGRCE